MNILELKRIYNEKFAEQMKHTEQSPKYHGEGNVYTHTQMVCKALISLDEYKELDETKQNILYAAALLHDIGKTKTTVFQDDDWHSPHHAATGSRMARELLFKEFNMGGTKELMQMRETICTLIRFHSFPPHAITFEEGFFGTVKMHRIAANSLLMPDFSIKMLCILAKADTLGRICDDQAEILEKIEFCKELAIEEGCYEGCYNFPSAQTRRKFLRGDNVWKDSNLYDNTWGTVYMMSGLPGVGKDYTIAKELGDIPMVSLDEIRRKNKVKATDNQGAVANVAKEFAKDHLRKHESFVWNATNLTSQMREQLVDLFESYGANVKIIYVESSYDTLSKQNKNRTAVVPQDVIDNMIKKLSPPLAYEAREVVWIGH